MIIWGLFSLLTLAISIALAGYYGHEKLFTKQVDANRHLYNKPAKMESEFDGAALGAWLIATGAVMLLGWLPYALSPLVGIYFGARKLAAWRAKK